MSMVALYVILALTKNAISLTPPSNMNNRILQISSAGLATFLPPWRIRVYNLTSHDYPPWCAQTWLNFT